MKQQLYIRLQNYAINVYTYRVQICKFMTVLSAVYLLFQLFSISVLIGFGILIISVYGLLYFQWRNYRQKGIINMLTPKVRKILLQRSIYDLYRDQVYYPYITKIISIFGHGAISKPHPEQLDKMIDKLPQNVKNTIYTKGILHLAPQQIQNLIIQKQPNLLLQLSSIPNTKPKIQPIQHKIKATLPKIYGTISPTWDRINQYEKQEIKIHENTISKQLLIKLNDKIRWEHIITLAGLVAFAVTKTRCKKLGRILLYNGSVIGIFMLVAIVIIKYKKPLSTNKKNRGE